MNQFRLQNAPRLAASTGSPANQREQHVSPDRSNIQTARSEATGVQQLLGSVADTGNQVAQKVSRSQAMRAESQYTDLRRDMVNDLQTMDMSQMTPEDRQEAFESFMSNYGERSGGISGGLLNSTTANEMDTNFRQQMADVWDAQFNEALTENGIRHISNTIDSTLHNATPTNVGSMISDLQEVAREWHVPQESLYSMMNNSMSTYLASAKTPEELAERQAAVTGMHDAYEGSFDNEQNNVNRLAIREMRLAHDRVSEQMTSYFEQEALDAYNAETQAKWALYAIDDEDIPDSEIMDYAEKNDMNPREVYNWLRQQQSATGEPSASDRLRLIMEGDFDLSNTPAVEKLTGLKHSEVLNDTEANQMLNDMWGRMIQGEQLSDREIALLGVYPPSAMDGTLLHLADSLTDMHDVQTLSAEENASLLTMLRAVDTVVMQNPNTAVGLIGKDNPMAASFLDNYITGVQDLKLTPESAALRSRSLSTARTGYVDTSQKEETMELLQKYAEDEGLDPAVVGVLSMETAAVLGRGNTNPQAALEQAKRSLERLMPKDARGEYLPILGDSSGKGVAQVRGALVDAGIAESFLDREGAESLFIENLLTRTGNSALAMSDITGSGLEHMAGAYLHFDDSDGHGQWRIIQAGHSYLPSREDMLDAIEKTRAELDKRTDYETTPAATRSGGTSYNYQQPRQPYSYRTQRPN